jgi:hypothetical protein
MKRTTLFLDEQLEHDLRALSKRKGLPLASVVREAMAQYVVNEKQRERTSVRFIASGRSGHTDTAERQEELLWGDLDPHGANRAVPSPKPARPRRRAAARRTRTRSR